MDVQGNGISILDGDTTPSTIDGTNMGSIVVGSPLTQTYSIINVGAANLNLTSASPYITIGGANAGDFSVVSIPTTPITAGNSTTFQIRFIPSAAGVRNATISIANNDSNENPYNFNIIGTGIPNTPPDITSDGGGQTQTSL